MLTSGTARIKPRCLRSREKKKSGLARNTVGGLGRGIGDRLWGFGYGLGVRDWTAAPGGNGRQILEAVE